MYHGIQFAENVSFAKLMNSEVEQDEGHPVEEYFEL